ncbi:MAG: phospholipase A [Verrucomicrobiia bacterium]
MTRARTFIWANARSLLVFSVLFLTSVVPAALGQEIGCTFVSPSQPLIAGTRSSLWLYCFNGSSNYIGRVFEPSLNCTLISQAVIVETVLVLNTNSSPIAATIPPGGFVKVEYVLDLPLTSSGQVTLDIRNYNQVAALVEQATTEVPFATQRPSASPVTNATPAYQLGEYFGTHLSFYEPIYFIGGSHPSVEFQVSLKYKVLDFKDNWNPLTHFYFAYTQTAFWSAFVRDPSFYDTSYKPSGFFYYPDILRNQFCQLDLQSGGEHESNGRGGTEERSINTVYLQPTVTVDLPDNFQFTLQPRAWVYFVVGDNNLNMADYRGYADLRTAVTWNDPNSGEKIQFATRLRLGDEANHAGLQCDLRFNLANAPLLRKFNPAIQLQYFTGYGQTLLQYNQPSNGYRAGICLWY